LTQASNIVLFLAPQSSSLLRRVCILLLNIIANMSRGRESLVPNYIDVDAARQTRVVHRTGALTADDIAQILKVQGDIARKEQALENNPQNKQHLNKSCTFLNRPPQDPLRTQAPQVLGKLLRAAVAAFDQGCWGHEGAGTATSGQGCDGPLIGIDVRKLSIRNVECWEYGVGGKLDNPLHFDAGSIVTIVAMLAEDFEGGTFRTFEPDETHLEHPMALGDVVCFVSHKYHNVTEVTRGLRKTLVIELWQGNLPLFLR